MKTLPGNEGNFYVLFYAKYYVQFVDVVHNSSVGKTRQLLSRKGAIWGPVTISWALWCAASAQRFPNTSRSTLDMNIASVVLLLIYPIFEYKLTRKYRIKTAMKPIYFELNNYLLAIC